MDIGVTPVPSSCRTLYDSPALEAVTSCTGDLQMAGNLAGKVAVVTGASKGIGAEIAIELGAAGATVVVNYAKSREGADRVVAAIQKAGGKAVAVQADMSKGTEIEK